MIDRRACRCPSCRARDARAFWRIAATLAPIREQPQTWVVWPETERLTARIAAYGYGQRGATP